MENPEIKKEETKEEKKLSKRDFIVIIFVILLLSGAIFWNFKNWRKSLEKVELPKFEMPKFEISPKKEGYKEWTSPDGTLKMGYPADWMEMESKTLENFPQAEIIGGKGKILFFAQKIAWEKTSLVFLLVQKLTFEEKRGAEEIIEEIKKGVEEKEGEMEIERLEIKNGEAVLEAKYKGKKGYELHSKEKIILNEKGYLISCFTFEKDWSEFQKEAEEIINSAQLIE